MSKKTFPSRPTADFRVTTFEWLLDSERRHTQAGFPEIPREVLVRRFWQLLHFLQENSMTTRSIASSMQEILPHTELRNSDLTQEGYLFVQRYFDRWVARMHKDAGELAEAKYLTKWHADLQTAMT